MVNSYEFSQLNLKGFEMQSFFKNLFMSAKPDLTWTDFVAKPYLTWHHTIYNYLSQS